MKILAITFCLLVTSFCFAQSRRGGGSDGGSCGIKMGQNWVLKDFVRAGFDLSRMSNQVAPTVLTLGPIGQNIGFEELSGRFGTKSFQENLAFTEALNRLENWKIDSPRISILLEQTIRNLNWGVVSREFQPIAFGCQTLNDFPIAIYQPDVMMVLLSAPMWNRMSFESQTGIVIKEAFRFLQDHNSTLVFNGEQKNDRTENLISELVTTIVFGTPVQNRQTLPNLFRKHNLPSELDTTRWNTLNQKLQTACRRVKSSLEVSINFLNDIAYDPRTKELIQRANEKIAFCLSTVLSDSIGFDRSNHQSEIQKMYFLFEPAFDVFSLHVDNLERVSPAAAQTLDQQKRKLIVEASHIHLLVQNAIAKDLLDSPETIRAASALRSISRDLTQCALNNDECRRQNQIHRDNFLMFESIYNQRVDRLTQQTINNLQSGLQSIFRVP